MINANDFGAHLIPPHYDPELYRIRHSTSHLLAWATQVYFAKEGEVIFGTGPAIQDGFYYDFLISRPLKEEDLTEIEAIMKNLVKEQHDFQLSQLEPVEANQRFKHQPFKLEIINDILSKQENNPVLTTYTVGEFTDLCRGPHVSSTKDINAKAFKLLTFSSAYWKGNSERETLTRIYGTAFRNEAELSEYLWLRAEAEKRDHRKLGKQLGLFHFDETAPGMPYWLPDGLALYHELIHFCRQTNKQNHYSEVSTPMINKKALWETSGHWEFYRDDMFLVTGLTKEGGLQEIEYALKPMNCPNAMVVYNLKRHSYRDLPLRIADCDTLHRNEASGALHGLLRVRQFHQDDAHIFITEDQIESECIQLLKLCQNFYSIFDMTYTFRLGTRPASFIGEAAVWDHAEKSLISILTQQVGKEHFIIAEGEGAFYGPKIDILMQDSLKRVWQMGTIQLDFQLPKRFACEYVDEKGDFKTCIVIHRAMYGSLERFIGVLIEHTAGNLPIWLAPKQVCLIPIADRHQAHCKEKAAELEESGIRVMVDARSERMNLKIRDAQGMKIPYFLVIGDKEISDNSVSCRSRFSKDSKTMSFDAFKAKIINEIKQKTFVETLN